MTMRYIILNLRNIAEPMEKKKKLKGVDRGRRTCGLRAVAYIQHTFDDWKIPHVAVFPKLLFFAAHFKNKNPIDAPFKEVLLQKCAMKN